MATFKDLLSRVKSEIEEVTVEDVHAHMNNGRAEVLIDVREPTEVADGHIEGAKLIPRGLLELRVEDQVPDRDQPIVIYCAGGIRSAFAVKSLEELGYRDVASMAGGFADWKRAGYPFTVPKLLSAEQQTRYSRHLLIPEVGEEGQQKLLGAKVLMLGAGGLGSPAAYYLAAAGVGKIGIIDSDVVDRSNLQRQILHTDDRVGMPKVDSARMTLEALNPDVEVVTYETRLDADNVLEIFTGWDVVIDGGDNFPTRYLVNDACVHLGIPNVHGSVYRFEGQVTVFDPGNGPCYRCLYPEPPPPELAPSCQEAGVLGVVPGIIGLLQATEAIKLILEAGNTLAGRLLTLDTLDMTFRQLKLRPDPECRMCGSHAEFKGFVEYEQFCSFQPSA